MDVSEEAWISLPVHVTVKSMVWTGAGRECGPAWQCNNNDGEGSSSSQLLGTYCHQVWLRRLPYVNSFNLHKTLSWWVVVLTSS